MAYVPTIGSLLQSSLDWVSRSLTLTILSFRLISIKEHSSLSVWFGQKRILSVEFCLLSRRKSRNWFKIEDLWKSMSSPSPNPPTMKPMPIFGIFKKCGHKMCRDHKTNNLKDKGYDNSVREVWLSPIKWSNQRSTKKSQLENLSWLCNQSHSPNEEGRE